jgi:hypothetical protein
MKERNAKITRTELCFEDHGIFTCYIYLDYGGAGQAFGGYALDDYDEKLDRRIGSRYGIEFLMKLLYTVGVSSWEQLQNRYVRVKADFNKVHAIGHTKENKWFDPEKLRKELKL